MDGVIIINKAKDFTSNDVVQKMRKILNTKKVGHTGTLDPNATGVLPILVGKGTKLSKYLIEHDKTYIATLKLGEKRSTGDTEGEIIKQKEVSKNMLDKTSINNVLKTFLGKQKQTPPIYSAIKINGKKLYEYAREGKQVEIPEREIEIYSIELKEINKETQEIIFEVSCSKGTYIRVLCEDIAEKLGTVGYMKELTRTKVNNFTIENSNTFEQLENMETNKIENLIINIEEIFKEKDKIILNNRKLELFLNGVMLTQKLPNELYRIYDEKNNFIGLGEIKEELLKRDIV